MKIRKKPIAVDAWIIDLTEVVYSGNMPMWVWDAHHKEKKIAVASDGGDLVLRIKTEEGIMTAKDGDVLVKGAHGEYYSIKKSIFDETYDIVEEEVFDEQDAKKEAIEGLSEDGSISVTDFTDLPDGSAMCAINMPYDTLLQFARIGLTHVIHREADRIIEEYKDVP